MSHGEQAGLLSQYKRQAEWLGDHTRWLFSHKVFAGATKERPRALDVGCGPGYMIDQLSDIMRITGTDKDPDMIALCRARDIDAVEGRAEELPFSDGEFDVVYCSWLLMWTGDPLKVIREMARVSSRWIICLAEPDVGARIVHPRPAIDVNGLVEKGLRDLGADPRIARKLRVLFAEAGLDCEMGVHPGIWDTERLGRELDDELGWLASVAGTGLSEKDVIALKQEWSRLVKEGSLFYFSPVFHAICDKGSHR